MLELIENPELSSRKIGKRVKHLFLPFSRKVRKLWKKSILSSVWCRYKHIWLVNIVLLIVIKQDSPHSVIKNNIWQNGKNNMIGSLQIVKPQIAISMVIQNCNKSSYKLLQILQQIKTLENIGRVEWIELHRCLQNVT